MRWAGPLSPDPAVPEQAATASRERAFAADADSPERRPSGTPPIPRSQVDQPAPERRILGHAETGPLAGVAADWESQAAEWERQGRTVAFFGWGGAGGFVAGAMPERKLEIIRALQAEAKVVAMFGDGVNDAPALAQSDPGIAPGSGADIAIGAAPPVLMNRDLPAVAEVFDPAHRTLRVARQNLFRAFA